MEKIVVNYLDGSVKQFIEPSGQIISGDSLIITTKQSVSNDDNEEELHLITTSDVIQLSKIRNFVKITPTRKFNIEEHVSDK